MKKLFLAVLIFVGLSQASVHAQVPGCPQFNSLVARQHEVIPVSNSAVGFTSATYNPTDGSPKAVCAIVQNISANALSYWGSMGVPTASDGQQLSQFQSVVIGPANLGTFKMIRVPASDSSAAVQYLVNAQ